MKVELNIKDFLTPAHKKAVQAKIDQAILLLDVQKLSDEIMQGLLEDRDLSFHLSEEINLTEVAKVINKQIIAALKK